MDNNKKHYEQWQDETIKCVKCGMCRAVCPIFAQLNHETVVARGKISLIEAMLQGKQAFSPRFQEVLSLCLVCKACTATCTGGVPVDELITRARTAFETKQIPFIKRAIFKVVRHHRLMNFLMRLGGMFQGLGFRRDVKKGGMYPRFPIGIARRRLITPLAGKPFTSVKRTTAKKGQGKMKVAFFTGCMINHIYHSVGSAVLDILEAGNIEVVIPVDQACCGTPMETSGDRATAAMLAKHNVETLLKEEVDAVIVACASCGCTLKKQYIPLIKEYAPELVDKAKELSSKVYDISEFYLKYLTDVKPSKAVKQRITYHDPCHLVRGQGISSEPREIFKSLPQAEYVEAPEADKCCGSGGSFCLIHYDLSTSINDEKIENIKETGADVLATGCPACMMHLNDGLARNNLDNIKVKHTVELLAESLDK